MALEFRDGESLVIQADLPGLDPERDVEVWVSHGVLHIRARSPIGMEELRDCSDLRDGSFTRDLALPEGAAERTVRATYVGGRLEVRAPAGGPVAHADRRVPVRRAGDGDVVSPAAGRPTASPSGPRQAAADLVDERP